MLYEVITQRLQKNVEYVKVQTIRIPYDRSQFILHNRRENDWTKGVSFGGSVDLLDGVARLVFGIYKWQSRFPKILCRKLSDQTVSKRFRGDASLVREKKNSAFSHPVDCPVPAKENKGVV